jgi:hypothetical protein
MDLQRLVALAESIELGVRTLKTGPMAGMQVRWGKHLRTKPFGVEGVTHSRGQMQIKDPKTKASMFIERSKEAYAQGVEEHGWVGGKHAYIANVGLPKKYRALPGNKAADVFAGGKAAEKIKAGVFGHFDKRGITASTIAGAYESTGAAARAEGTHGLVKMYQKRGFKIDKHDLPNDWNVPMKRTPGAGKQKPIGEKGFGNLMGRIRSRARSEAIKGIGENLKPLAAPAAVLAGTGAAVGVTAHKAHHEGEHQETAKKALKPAVIAGAAIAGGAIHPFVRHAQDLRDAGRWAGLGGNAVRVGIGKRLAGRGRVGDFIARQALRGFV